MKKSLPVAVVFCTTLFLSLSCGHAPDSEEASPEANVTTPISPPSGHPLALSGASRRKQIPCSQPFQATEVILFHHHGLDYPGPEKAAWILREIHQHGLGQGLSQLSAADVASLFRADLYDQAHLLTSHSEFPPPSISHHHLAPRSLTK